MLVRFKEFARFLFILLAFGISCSLASVHCQKTMKNSGSRVRLDLGCEAGKLTWINPEEERMISFTDRKRSFKVCFDSARAGASVYRVEGSAKTLISSNSEPGRIACLDSDCKHVTLLLQPSSSDTPLEYNYTASITNVCPTCTSDCQRKCFCNSQFVFVAEVLKSRLQKNQRYHQNYVKLRYFLRHNGNFTSLLGKIPASCENKTSSTAANHQVFIPHYGMLKVKSKCSLQTGKTYLFSASLHHTRHNPSLTMCCAQENYKHAWKFYSYLLNNRRCCY